MLLPVFILINFFVAFSVNRAKFKTCEQSGFCNRLLNQPGTSDRFFHDQNKLVCKNGKITTLLHDKLMLVNLIFTASALSNNRLRLHITEEQPQFPRFDLFQDTWKGQVSEPEPDRNVKTVRHDNSRSCMFIFGSNYFANFTFEPFHIALSDNNNETFMTFNDENTVLVEPHITKLNNSKKIGEKEETEELTDSGSAPSQEDSVPSEFFDGATDTLPHGYQGVSFDATFYDFPHVFGIPEHADTFSLNTSGAVYRLFNLDVFEYELYNGMALYGSNPFMVASNSRHSLGLLFLNPSEMWVKLDKQSSKSMLSFLSLGQKSKVDSIRTRWVAESGNIDIIVMMGSKPHDITYQYSLTTGFPSLPPLFSIAYHQCRWNYNDEQDVANVDQGFDHHQIPNDVIWLDIEHTPSRQYFKYDESKFPHFNQMIRNLSAKGRKMVTVVDPHVKKLSGYFVYDEAINKGYEVKTNVNATFVGWCWPGDSIYPNYLDPDVRRWYATLFDPEKYLGSTTDLHTWVDMNEPSVFNGPEVTIPKDTKHGVWENRDVHNLYSQMCIDAAYQGGMLRGKQRIRPFILSRAFFSGSQRYGAVWTGDNRASWDHLKITVPMLLSISVTGIPFVGADISGFFGNPEEELFIRWYQAGSMQPFMRGHSHIETQRREPWSFTPETTNIIRDQIQRRYRYLPYLYTAFYESHKYALPVMRPLWYEFPLDSESYKQEDAYILGSSLLIKPIVQPKTTSVSVYFPSNDDKTFWLGLFNNVVYPARTAHHIVMNSITELPMFQRSATIVPTWERPRRASSKMHQDPITLTVVLDQDGSANGTFYIDDTESFDYDSGEYSLFKFNFLNNQLVCGVVGKFKTPIWVERVRIHGLKTKFNQAIVTSSSVHQFLDVQNTGPFTIIRKPGVRLTDGFIIKLSQ